MEIGAGRQAPMREMARVRRAHGAIASCVPLDDGGYGRCRTHAPVRTVLVPPTPSLTSDEEESMPHRTIGTTVDVATVERLSSAFNRCFETFEADDDLFTPDAFFDLYPPLWRFQLQGPAVFAAQLRTISHGPTTSRILRVVPTASGFVMENEETAHGAPALVARHLWLCEIRDGRIAEAVGYCNGGWDDELRARQAAEAPMLRP